MASSGPETHDVLGIPIAAVTIEEVLDWIDARIETGEQSYVCVCSVNNVMSSRKDPELAAIHRSAGLCVPDGYPLWRVADRRSDRPAERIRGTDLMAAAIERAAETGHSVYFYGGAPGVPEDLAEVLKERHPDLEVAGTWSPPFRPLTPEEDAEIVKDINASGADIVWVGLSTPKQERWMKAHEGRIDASVMLGVGAAFDFLSGNKDPAPRWISDAGFEWLWRFAHEPRRLWRRVLVQGPRFVGGILKEEVGRRRGEGP